MTILDILKPAIVHSEAGFTWISQSAGHYL